MRRARAIRVRCRYEAGFTLVEMLIAIAILGILVLIALPTFIDQQEKGRDTATKQYLSDADHVGKTIWINHENEYPALGDAETEGSLIGALSHSEPQLTFGDTASTSDAHLIAVERINADRVVYVAGSPTGKNLLSRGD